MTIFVNSDTRVIVQGMTGAEGRKHTQRMLSAGTTIVGGTNPRKAGTTVTFDVAGYGPGADKVTDGQVEVPVFGTVAEAREATGANASVIFVPPAFAKGAALEAIEAGIETIVLITEGIPVQDSTIVVERALAAGVRLIGPNCPGIISPGQANLGITPADITGPGRLGLVSKSGTLTYQLMYELRDFGFTTCLGIGGDPVVGTTHIDALAAFEADPDTDLVIMIGEIGGDAEERAAAWIQENMTKPVVAYIAGFTAPEGKTMGHAGAIVSGSSGTAAAKAEALEAVGVRVGRTPSQPAQSAREMLSRYRHSTNRPGVGAQRRDPGPILTLWACERAHQRSTQPPANHDHVRAGSRDDSCRRPAGLGARRAGRHRSCLRGMGTHHGLHDDRVPDDAIELVDE